MRVEVKARINATIDSDSHGVFGSPAIGFISFDNNALPSIPSHSTDERCHKRFPCRYVVVLEAVEKRKRARRCFAADQPRTRACPTSSRVLTKSLSPSLEFLLPQINIPRFFMQINCTVVAKEPAICRIVGILLAGETFSFRQLF